MPFWSAVLSGSTLLESVQTVPIFSLKPFYYLCWDLNCLTPKALFEFTNAHISICWLTGFVPRGDWVLLITFFVQTCHVSVAEVCLVVSYEDFNSFFSYSGSRSACIPPTPLAFAHDNERLLSIWMASPITLSCGRAGILELRALHCSGVYLPPSAQAEMFSYISNYSVVISYYIKVKFRYTFAHSVVCCFSTCSQFIYAF